MRPSAFLVRWVGIFVLLSLGATLSPLLLQVWQGLMSLFVLIVLTDAGRTLFARPPEVQRRVDSALPLGVWRKVTLCLANKTRGTMNLRVHDMQPEGLSSRKQPFQMTLEPLTEGEQYYEIKPLSRGALLFGKTHVLLASPWSFWWRSFYTGEDTEVRVYPNFQAVAKFMMLDVGRRLAQIGIHRRRRRGEGREFHQLREFVQGDSMRQIDWKASSRMRKIISREFRDERDQQVLFLMDCGQSMRTRDGELGHFDHALNAVLLMASVALRHGDAVGMMTFSGEKRRLAARKGTAQLNLLLNNIYDIQPTLQTSDYLTLARDVLVHCRKRTLLILVTNLKDEDDGELAPALKMLRSKHLVLLASMRERILHDTLEQSVDNFEDALTISGTHTYLKRRRKIHESFNGKGVICLDVVPDQLPVSMVNSYLDIKARGIL